LLKKRHEDVLDGLAEVPFYEKQIITAKRSAICVLKTLLKYKVEKILKNKEIYAFEGTPLTKNDFMDCIFQLRKNASDFIFTASKKYNREEANESAKKINYGVHRIIAKR